MFEEAIVERNAYRLASKGRAKNGKGARYECPITTGGLPQESHPPEPLRAQCCTRSLTIPDSMLGKHYQKHIWGSRKWFESFARRTAVERCFADMKYKGGLRPGWTLQVGLVKTTFVAAITVMAYNFHTLLRWAKNHGRPQASFITGIEVKTFRHRGPRPRD